MKVLGDFLVQVAWFVFCVTEYLALLTWDDFLIFCWRGVLSKPKAGKVSVGCSLGWFGYRL